MGKMARSARGQTVDFDLLAITQALATAPVPVSVDDRRKFINEKDGIKAKNSKVGALSLGFEAAEQSAAAAPLAPETILPPDVSDEEDEDRDGEAAAKE